MAKKEDAPQAWNAMLQALNEGKMALATKISKEAGFYKESRPHSDGGECYSFKGEIYGRAVDLAKAMGIHRVHIYDFVNHGKLSPTLERAMNGEKIYWCGQPVKPGIGAEGRKKRKGTTKGGKKVPLSCGREFGSINKFAEYVKMSVGTIALFMQRTGGTSPKMAKTLQGRTFTVDGVEYDPNPKKTNEVCNESEGISKTGF